MRKMVFVILATALAVVGCDNNDKKSGQGNYLYAPNNCYAGGASQYNYQWINGQCVDVARNAVVAPQYCQNQNYSYNQNCSYYGGYNYGYWGTPTSSACSMYNNGSEVFYPVFDPYTGATVCVGYYTYNFFYGYGTPMYYPGAPGVLYGCTPGAASCNCQSYGGTLGWVSGGVSMGICY